MIIITCKVCNKRFEVIPSRFKRGDTKYCSLPCKYKDLKGRKLSQETRIKMSKSQSGNKNHFYGKHHSTEVRKKLSELHSGERHRDWKGGITPINERIRKSFEYKLWRESVFRRDNYTCVWCGDNRGGNLQADHIKPFALYPELRFAIDNGRTLCVDCHRTTFTYGKKN